MAFSTPVYLDTLDEQRASEPKESSARSCPTCEARSKAQPTQRSSVSAALPTSSSGPTTVPVLKIETLHFQHPHPAFQLAPDGKSRLRFRRNAFSPLSAPIVQRDDVDWNRRSHVGLGISRAQANSDTSPITPGTAEKQGEQRAEDPQAATNLAQRIEQKLWKYSASGNVVKRWLPEIISWSISAICMAGIVAMLLVYNNRRIPHWPLGLTLSAYISILSKIASAALLLPVSEALGQLKWSWFHGKKSRKMWDFEIFDNASRGAWGSLLLLMRTRGKTLAALGAAVTLFALALDPFFQQVLEYPEHWRIQSGNGSIPAATSYAPNQSGIEYREGLQYLELDQDMLAVGHHFFYDNGTRPITFGRGVRAEIPLSCPSSNCTWPQYETLGICSKCANVSGLLEFQCINTTLDWVQVPDADPNTDEVTFPNGTSCGWYLKADNPLLMTGYNVDRDTAHSGEILMMRAQPLYDIFTREPLPGYPAKFNDTRNPLAHVVIASGENLNKIQQNSTPIAHECVLSWCVKTMLSAYAEGAYTESVTQTFFNNTLGPSPWVITEVHNDNSNLSSTDYTYYENVIVKGESETAYHVDNSTHVLTLSLFDDIFPSSYTLTNSTSESDAMLRHKAWVVVGPMTRNLTYNPWLYGNVSTHLDNLATAMTNMVRSSPGGTEMVTSPAYERESYVEVRWAWLSLPLALLGLSFIFLVVTVIRSSLEREHVGVWKTSAIAMLLYGLPDEMQKKMAGSKEKGTPRARAKAFKVKLHPGAGWTFSGNGSSPVAPKPGHAATSTEWR